MSPLPAGHRRWVFAAVGAVAALVAVGGTVGVLRGNGGLSVSGSSVEIAHVHGLGVDPLAGVLLAGTHHGLFRLPQGGQAARVGEQVQDFMGFTVAGPNHYLASGHPGPAQLGPKSVGLIESTDGGQSWQSLSLEGKADFHALEARHGLVYGLDALSGDLMVSQDKRTWQTRGDVPIADFAVSPDDAEVLLATTERGLARSEDGGETYALVAAAPALLLVSWAEDGTVVGVDQDGVVYASADGVRTWQRRGSLGSAPHALTATSGSDVFAAVDGAILASLDGGRSFDVRYRE